MATDDPTVRLMVFTYGERRIGPGRTEALCGSRETEKCVAVLAPPSDIVGAFQRDRWLRDTPEWGLEIRFAIVTCSRDSASHCNPTPTAARIE